METELRTTDIFDPAELARLDQFKAAVDDGKVSEWNLESPKNPQSPQESITPFFDINKSASHYRFLVEEFGQEKGTEIARKTFIRDLESQAWELSEIPTPYKYKLLLKDGKLIHESNVEDGTDIDEVVSDKIRKGLEKKQLKLYKQAAQNMKVGETGFRISPKRTASELASDCPYPDSQIFIFQKVIIDGREWISERQFQCDLDEKELAKAFNILIGQEIIDPQASLEDILLTVATSEKYVSDLVCHTCMRNFHAVA